MKKLFVLLVVFALGINLAEARDYTKLQIKEMKKNQKYGTTQKYVQKQEVKTNTVKQTNLNLKDPKILKFGNYEKIDSDKYSKKIQKDEKEYSEIKKQLCKRTIDNYNAQAKGEDYYRIYRIAEKIIRANNLDYINWRIGIYRDADSQNAYTTSTNYIALSSAMVDSFIDNDDALAVVIGHEMGHALLGHQARKASIRRKVAKLRRMAIKGGTGYAAAYAVQLQRLRIESKNMEYAADVEGAKLASKAGFDLDKGVEVLKLFETYSDTSDWRETHPNPTKRIENYNQNRKYFPEQWKEIGEYNIYNSDVLKVQTSSDRTSIILQGAKTGSDGCYNSETMQDLYARFAYTSYLNGEFEKSLKYFDKLFSIDSQNAPAYLYASYASECLYKNTGNSKYLKEAKEFAQKAQSLDSQNKYIKEQVDSL